jgi:hypothetical protein
MVEIILFSLSLVLAFWLMVQVVSLMVAVDVSVVVVEIELLLVMLLLLGKSNHFMFILSVRWMLWAVSASLLSSYVLVL